VKKISAIVCSAACLAAPASVLAQAPAAVPGEDNGIVGWVVAVALAGVVLAAGFWNPKRSHLT